MIRRSLLGLAFVLTMVIPSVRDYAHAGPMEDITAAAEAVNDGDYPTALRLFHKLADEGYPGGQLGLGSMYFSGAGVPQDYAEAFKWYRLAASSDHYIAEFEIGAMYDRGLGVARDFTEAAKWYRLSADQGYFKAQFNLGLMYAQGVGVPKDYVQAYKWFVLAGSKASATEASEVSRSRDVLAKKMTADQIAEGRQMASEWAQK